MNRQQLITFAESYLANNAAESGTDELIRMLVAELRSLAGEVLPEPAWCGHCGETCRCGEYE